MSERDCTGAAGRRGAACGVYEDRRGELVSRSSRFYKKKAFPKNSPKNKKDISKKYLKSFKILLTYFKNDDIL